MIIIIIIIILTLLTYIRSLLNDVGSSELASATLRQNFLIKSSLFSVTTNMSESRLFITPSSSLEEKSVMNKVNDSMVCTTFIITELQICMP